MKIIKTYEGERTKSGWHTGFSLIEKNGKLYICNERGTRPATTKEIIEHYEKIDGSCKPKEPK
jgi:hypothetical protein